MRKKLLWITETACMLALLVTAQALTKPLGQLVTGSFVNGILAVTALVAGIPSGLAVAVLSPVLAYLLGIAPNILTVPAIMAGNALYVTVLCLVSGRSGTRLRRAAAWLCAAAVKFAVLYGAVVWLICGVFSRRLLETGVLKAPMLQALPAAFSWPQLITALLGGAAALLMAPVIRKALPNP